METLRFLMISTHFPPHHLGGDAVLVEYLSRELADRGHEVHVVYNPAIHNILRKDCAKTNERSDVLGIVRHPIVARAPVMSLHLALSLGLFPGARAEISNLSSQLKPDVVHWHNTKGFLAPPTVTNESISLYTAHDYYAVCPRSNFLKPDLTVCTAPRRCQFCHLGWMKPMPLWRIGRRRVLRFPDATKILCPSKYMAEQLSKDGIRVDSVLRNFVPDPGMAKNAAHQDTNSILYLGMLEPHKGLKTLIRAFSVSRGEQGFTLDIVGEGSLKEDLMETVSIMNLTNRVRIHGFISREQIADIRLGAAAQIVPSEWPENAPLSAIEALAMGMPLIGSNLGGLPEILNVGPNHQEFQAGNADDLARCLVSAWNSREQLASVSSRVRADYESNFTPEIHINDYLKRVRS